MSWMVEVIVIVSTAVATALTANFLISVFRRHQERSCININIDHVLDDARDVSMRVDDLTRQLGGRA